MNEYTNEELIRMARWQRRLLYALVYSWVCGLFIIVLIRCCDSASIANLLLVAKYVINIAFAVVFYVIYYKLLLTYHSQSFKIFAGVLGVLMAVPLVNLIMLLVVTNPATRILKTAGLRVGLLGVSEHELCKLQD